MAFTGATPWHGLGASLNDPTNVDACFRDAKLDYTAILGSVFDPAGQRIPFARSIVRDTDGKCVGVVGTGFEPLQTSEMADFLRPWVETGHARVETAGNLRDGRRVWALARLRGSAEIGDGDRVDRFLLVAQAHDGSMSIRAGLTPVRVVCANTLAAAQGGGSLVRIKHTSSAKDKLAAVRDAMLACKGSWQATIDQFRAMSKVRIAGEDAVRSFMRAVYRDKVDPSEKKRNTREDAIVGLFEAGKGQDLTAARGTAWGLYNALTEYVTHATTRRGGLAARAESLGMGSGAMLLERGRAIISEILDNGRLASGGYSIDDVFGAGSSVVERAERALASA